MPRIQINAPAFFQFKTQIQVRVTDLNYGNHLANDKVQAYLQQSRVEMLHQVGLSELNIGDNTSLIQGDAAIIYQSEGYLLNQIDIMLAVNDFGNSSFDVVYQLNNLSTSKPLALAKTRLVCFNYEERKVMPVPESFISAINSLAQIR
ncbi:thioesterase [bacterium]|nr:thioesterase [bacterium]